MKSFILSGLIAATVAVLPVSGMANANPLLHFDPSRLAAQTADCGDPTDPMNTGFCSCFTSAIIDGCYRQPVHPRCDVPNIKASIKTYGVASICSKYSPVPSDVCITDINYWLSSCGI